MSGGIGAQDRALAREVIGQMGLAHLVDRPVQQVDTVAILPAIAARQVGRSLKGALLWGALFGTIANLVGLGLAFAFDLPVSPAIIVVGAAIVLLGWIRPSSHPSLRSPSG